MSIQSETYSPQHMSSERQLWVQWTIGSVALFVFSLVVSLAIAPLWFWASQQKFGSKSWAVTYDYLIRAQDPAFVLTAYHGLMKMTMMGGIITIGSAFMVSLFISAIFYAACPYQNFDATHGRVMWAQSSHIRKMERRKQIGVEGGFLGVLGKMPDGQYLRLIETISVACPAPPGSGKTAAVVVPAIVLSPDVSFIVNDPKPELADMTSGYRAETGYVFILDWSKTDKPEDGDFNPRFNFLSTSLVPPAGTAERDTYLDAIARVLIPEPKGGGDKYFVDKGRDAMTGFMHYLVSEVNDQRNYADIPLQWHGMEASFPMFIDWYTFTLHRMDKLAKEQNANGNPMNQVSAEGLFFEYLCDRALANEYSPRAFTSLSPLKNMADKERSGVLGTMDQAMLPFKNKAVMERTSACDFTSKDLRGMQDPETGEWFPVTLYICVNQAEAAAFANITALLYEVLSRDFLSYGPNEQNKRGETMGPFPICFMMDEFAKLPKCETVIRGPDLGRSKKTSYWLFYQAKPQLTEIYGKEASASLESTIGAHVVLPQNDPDTANHYVKMVGKTTILKKSHSRNAGFSKTANPMARNESISSEGIDFFRTEDITSMEPGTHIVLAQGFHNRPIKVRSPFFFQDPEMLEKVYNLRTRQGPKPAQPLPEHIRLQRVEEWAKRQKSIQEAEAAKQQEGLKTIANARQKG